MGLVTGHAVKNVLEMPMDFDFFRMGPFLLPKLPKLCEFVLREQPVKVTFSWVSLSERRLAKEH